MPLLNKNSIPVVAMNSVNLKQVLGESSVVIGWTPLISEDITDNSKSESVTSKLLLKFCSKFCLH